jgi:hypothetical protein
MTPYTHTPTHTIQAGGKILGFGLTRNFEMNTYTYKGYRRRGVGGYKELFTDGGAYFHMKVGLIGPVCTVYTLQFSPFLLYRCGRLFLFLFLFLKSPPFGQLSRYFACFIFTIR